MIKKLGVLVLFMMILISCNDDIDFRVECAVLEEGWVHVINDTRLDLWIDVTWGSMKENKPILVDSDRMNTTVATVFQEVPNGEAKIWWSYNGEDWNWKTCDVLTCEKTYVIITMEDI